MAMAQSGTALDTDKHDNTGQTRIHMSN